MAIRIFFCYAHEDEDLLNKLKTHLKPLQRQGLIDVWYDRDISAGIEWEQEIDKHLNTADIILLLVSPDFMASDYCYSVEMQRALERHEHGDACVIPIILRRVYWQGVLGKLQALPTDAKPVKSWPDLDEALFDVTNGVRNKANQLILANRFKEAYQNDEDDEILTAYEEIQRSPYKQLIPFTEQQLQRVALAREAPRGIEQLWYTYTYRGLASFVGYQIRAASKGLQNTKNEHVRDLGKYLHYDLPLGTTVYDVPPMIAPICLAFLLTKEGERILVNTSYLGRDAVGRPGNFFCHLLTGLSKEFSARNAIRLWRSSLWQISDQSLSPQSYTLPRLTLQDLDLAKGSFSAFLPQDNKNVQSYLPFLIQAYLTRKEHQQIFIAAPSDEIASLIFGLTLSLPEQLLSKLTFSTYEYDVTTTTEQIIGTCWLDSAASVSGNLDLPPTCYATSLAFNCFTGKKSDLVEKPFVRSFAEFATENLLEKSSSLTEFLERTSSIDDIDTFLSLYAKEILK